MLYIFESRWGGGEVSGQASHLQASLLVWEGSCDENLRAKSQGQHAGLSHSHTQMTRLTQRLRMSPGGCIGRSSYPTESDARLVLTGLNYCDKQASLEFNSFLHLMSE